MVLVELLRSLTQRLGPLPLQKHETSVVLVAALHVTFPHSLPLAALLTLASPACFLLQLRKLSIPCLKLSNSLTTRCDEPCAAGDHMACKQVRDCDDAGDHRVRGCLPL